VSPPRAVPWADLMEALGPKPFADIREALAAGQVDPADRDAFLLLGPAGALLRRLMPPDAPAADLTEYGAIVHALYRHWDAGHPVRSLDRPTLDAALADRAPLSRPPAAPTVCYLQFPASTVWAAPAPDAPHEPLDGCFIAASASAVSVLAILGFRPERGGFTVIEAAATLPLAPPGPREDGSAPFASLLPAGERAGLRSIATPGELAAAALLALAATSA
jgi:hypothetical protein